MADEKSEKVSVSLRLDADLVSRLDAVAFALSKPGDMKSRTEVVVMVIEKGLPTIEKEMAKAK